MHEKILEYIYIQMLTVFSLKSFWSIFSRNSAFGINYSFNQREMLRAVGNSKDGQRIWKFNNWKKFMRKTIKFELWWTNACFSRWKESHEWHPGEKASGLSEEWYRVCVDGTWAEWRESVRWDTGKLVWSQVMSSVQSHAKGCTWLWWQRAGGKEHWQFMRKGLPWV